MLSSCASISGDSIYCATPGSHTWAPPRTPTKLTYFVLEIDALRYVGKLKDLAPFFALSFVAVGASCKKKEKKSRGLHSQKYVDEINELEGYQ